MKTRIPSLTLHRMMKVVLLGGIALSPVAPKIEDPREVVRVMDRATKAKHCRPRALLILEPKAHASGVVAAGHSYGVGRTRHLFCTNPDGNHVLAAAEDDAVYLGEV